MDNLYGKRPVYKTYKDRVFRLLCNDKKRLLEIYNALNNTKYTDDTDLTINTLENAIFIKMKNDISFIIDCNLCLYEHQSTYCPNMPLRGFLYFADLYKKLLQGVDLSAGRQIKIPTPHYIVFYNGTEKEEEEFTQQLSDAFEDDGEGCIQLTVRTINVNLGHNKELMEKCSPLYGYACFVDIVRQNLKNMGMQEAVEKAVDECIEKNILKDFLTEQKSEVIAMSLYEYNEEYVRKTFFEEGMETGYQEGKEEGIKEGIKEGKAETLIKSVESVMQKFQVSLQKACEGVGTTVEDYDRARKELLPHKAGAPL